VCFCAFPDLSPPGWAGPLVADGPLATATYCEEVLRRKPHSLKQPLYQRVSAAQMAAATAEQVATLWQPDSEDEDGSSRLPRRPRSLTLWQAQHSLRASR
jgi:hypothetical protein